LTNNTADIDLNIGEFCNKVNTVLVNNIGNLHHRTLIFIERYFNAAVPDAGWDESIAKTVESAAAEIGRCFEEVEFKAVVEKIQALGNLGNKYYQDTKPWDLIKTDREEAAKVMVTCVNLIKACAVFLKPFVPSIAEKIEKQFGVTLGWDDYAFSLRGRPVAKTEKIGIPIEQGDFNALFGGTMVADEKDMQDAYIDIKDFRKVALKVGVIKNAENIKKSDKLLKLTVDDGGSGRQIIGGIAKAYQPQDLIGRRIVFVANLKPATLMGQKSEGMVLAALDGEAMSLIQPDGDIAAGAPIS
jgi:methionyl-tRNA synthetase